MSEPTDLTLYTLTLGAQDATTGWYAPTLEPAKTIKGAIRERGASLSPTGHGPIATYKNTLFTQDPHAVDDIIKDSFNDYYKVQTVQKIPWTNSLFCYQSELVQKLSADTRPTTSGTWPTVNDPAYRQKLFLTTYITAANIKEDDNATNASYIVALGMPDYSLNRVFYGKAVDVIYSVGDVRTTPMVAGSLSTYGYQHDVDIDIYAVDKTNLTGRRVVYAAERELQNTLEDYPAYNYNLRSYNTGRLEPVELGSLILWHIRVTVNYERTLDE